MKLEILNHWWKERRVRKEFIPEIKRNLFYELIPYLNKKQIISLVGLRRVGKTTMLYQLIQYLIEKGVDPFHILYFSFDEEKEDLDEILGYYEKEILKKNLAKERVFLFLDEIQKLEKWQDKLKFLYDTHPKMKIIISGSASIDLIFHGKETLAGRIFYFYLDLLSFDEFLKFKNVSIEKIKKRPELWREEIETLVREYLEKPFPEIVNASGIFVKKYLKEGIVDRVIIKDIKELFEIRGFEVLEKLIKLIFLNPGLIMNLEQFSKELGISRQALSNYLYYLETTYLIRSAGNFRGSIRASSRKLRKYYPVHPCFSLAFNCEDKGKFIENLVLFLTKAKYYWREKEKEVDFVLENITPVEVKFKKEIKRQDFKYLEYFMKKFKCKKALMISKNTETKKGKIKIIPLWKFILK